MRILLVFTTILWASNLLAGDRADGYSEAENKSAAVQTMQVAECIMLLGMSAKVPAALVLAIPECQQAMETKKSSDGNKSGLSAVMGSN